MKKIALILAAILLMAGAFFYYQKFERDRLIDLIAPHVKNASLHVTNSARYEVKIDTNITYGEFFKKLESDITELDKQLIEVQTIVTPETKELTDPVIEYLITSQEFLRAMLQMNHKHLENKNAHEYINVTIEEIKSASTHDELDTAKRNADLALVTHENTANLLKEATTKLLDTAIKLKEAHAKVAAILPADALIQVEQLDAIISKYHQNQ